MTARVDLPIELEEGEDVTVVSTPGLRLLVVHAHVNDSLEWSYVVAKRELKSYDNRRQGDGNYFTAHKDRDVAILAALSRVRRYARARHQRDLARRTA